MISKIFKNIIITVIVTTILTIGLFLSVLYRQFNSDIRINLKEEVNYIAQGLNNIGLSYFEGLKSSNRITLIDINGNVLYDNQKNSLNMENHNERHEIIEAKENGEGYSSRFSTTTLRNEIYYAKVLNDGSIIRISAKSSTIAQLLIGMSSQIFWIFLIALLVAYLIANKISKQIVKPINEIDLENPNQVSTYKEINPLLVKIAKQNHTINKQIKELNKRQLEFKSITDNMNEGLILINKELKILSYNHSALNMMSVDNIDIGESVYQFYHSNEFIDALNQAINGDNSEIKVKHENKTYEIIISPVKDNNKVSGATIIIFDKTDKEMQETMRREFSANVSHELKTPLTSIIGFSEIMKNNMVDSNDVPEIAANIYDEAKRLINLVEDIIHLSSLDSNEIKTTKENVNLKTMINVVINHLKNSANKRNIKINFTGDDVNYYGVYSILEEIVYNLVDNAIKYGKNDGHINVTLIKNNEEVIVEISDDGIGIHDEDLDRIFERFYRVDKSHSKEIGGTGLGLSIVKHGVIFHDGYIDVKSKYNSGSTFTVHLPI